MADSIPSVLMIMASRCERTPLSAVVARCLSFFISGFKEILNQGERHCWTSDMTAKLTANTVQTHVIECGSDSQDQSFCTNGDESTQEAASRFKTWSRDQNAVKYDNVNHYTADIFGGAIFFRCGDSFGYACDLGDL